MNCKSNTRKIVLTALFATLACVATMIINVPTLATNGCAEILVLESTKAVKMIKKYI